MGFMLDEALDFMEAASAPVIQRPGGSVAASTGGQQGFAPG